MTDATSIGLATAFAAGLVSFLSPCVLPLVPGYVSFIAGQSAQRVHAHLAARLATLGTSAFFVAGFSTVFIAFGASASALGQLVARYRYEANIVGGIVIILFGLLMLGMLRRFAWLQRDLRFHPRIVGGNPVTAYVIGLAFGFGWTPCIGPVLGAILALSAVGTTAGASRCSAPTHWGLACRSWLPRCSWIARPPRCAECAVSAWRCNSSAAWCWLRSASP